VDDLVDFSANLNPLGYPPGLARALNDALPRVVHYPDRRCGALTAALAGFHGQDPAAILVGNGSTELIFLLVRALKPQKALIIAPAFSEYAQALTATQVPLAYHYTAETQHFTLGGPVSANGADLVFLANPASPSGALVPPDRLAAIISPWLAAGARVVLDEAFIDFAEEASLKRHVGKLPGLMILRSFTKIYAIPGIRLGYLLGAPDLVQQVAASQEPWSVGSLAQAAGLACLADRDYLDRSRDLVSRERAHLANQLTSLGGLTVFPSAANYLLVKITRPGWTASRLRQALLAQSLIIRDASNFAGLDDRFVRLAVRRREENDRLLTALAQVLKEG
jgi:threonine-phosphate decarboxylase